MSKKDEKSGKLKHARALWGAEVVELAGAGEDDDADLRVAEHADLLRLLEDPVLALREGHLAVALVLDPLDLDLPAPHPSSCCSFSLQRCQEGVVSSGVLEAGAGVMRVGEGGGGGGGGVKEAAMGGRGMVMRRLSGWFRGGSRKRQVLCLLSLGVASVG